MLFVQNEGKGSGDCVEGLAAGLSGGFLPDAPDSFLVDFSFQSCSVGSLVRERVPFQMALSFEREM